VKRVQEQQVRAADPRGPFTVEQINALVAALEGTDVTTLRWNRKDDQLVIRRGSPAPVAQVVHHAANVALPAPAELRPPARPTPAIAPLPAAPAAKAEAKPGVVVTSPLVGTFYRAPSPDSPPFVDVGTVVKKGQVLCIVEAMKLMNELEAEVSGKVAEILVANATPVEFGEPLFRIEPA
jgi:acetyl-CoA carboxylase biotin carboxyl carrier protein